MATITRLRARPWGWASMPSRFTCAASIKSCRSTQSPKRWPGACVTGWSANPTHKPTHSSSDGSAVKVYNRPETERDQQVKLQIVLSSGKGSRQVSRKVTGRPNQSTRKENMSIVIGKSDTPNEIAVSGTAFPEAPPGATNIGVKGDGGVGIFIPVPGVPIKGIAIGVFGTSAGAGVGVQGVNSDNKAMGFLGGIDPRFNQLAGVYGESGQQGIIGHATNDTGTGVFGDSTGGGFGDRK